jgi:hypothetical protein
VLLAAAASASASEYHGVVTFGGLPVPGATVTVTQGGKKIVTVTDTQGFYSFPTLADGAATVEIAMTGFASAKQDVTIAAGTDTAKFELKLLTLDQMRADLKPVVSAPFTETQTRSEVVKTSEPPKATAEKAAAAAAPPEEIANRAADGLLVNGSVNNAATSQFTLGPRFGNTASGRALYSFNIFVRADSSALDAKSYSVTGINSTKPNTDQLTGGVNVQGPLKIPGVLHNGPNIFVGYSRTRNSVSQTIPGLVPTAAERAGDLSALLAATAGSIYAPTSGLSTACIAAGVVPGAKFAGNKIPAACIASQAQSLLTLYPQPNITPTSSIYNYQQPLVTDTHNDSVTSNVSKGIGRKNQVTGTLAASSTRTSTETLLGFNDANRVLGISTTVNWNHTVNAHLRFNAGYQYSRQSTRSIPFFAFKQNVSGNAQIAGNDQDPAYWGPPTLDFSSGTQPLTDAQQSFIRNQTNGLSFSVRWTRNQHNITAGGDFRRQEFNYLRQRNARGVFYFSGVQTGLNGVSGTGSDVADFLLGLPDTSQISFGNADKYLRESVYDLYATDDWRASPQVTLNYGVRWEYGAPVTEIKNRLVNLDVASGFAAVSPVLSTAPKGSLTGMNYPASLMNSDRSAVQPRVGVSWRPLPGSSLIVSAGYGVTYDTSVYQGIALNMAEQAPLPNYVSQIASASGACPLTLAAGFTQCLGASTFGVDPNFRVGYLQTWDLKLQRDLPESLQMVATYLGNKGTRGAQLFLPNTTAVTNYCPTGPCGFEYLASGGNSTRESLQLQLRRRLTAGFTASVLYTYSKSIDDDSALGGQGAATLSSASIAQDWRNLNGERGLSSFDQRHLLNVTAQYTTGMGKGGGTLLSGWRGRVYKEWTVQTTIAAGSGLPQTPFASSVTVAGFNSTVRPNLTGQPLKTASGTLNRNAYVTPVGMFGNARRNSIEGPNTISLSAVLNRTFRLTPKVNLDAQIAGNNALNHVSFTSYYNDINSTQFGLLNPSSASAMRTVQVTLRLRF